MKDLEFLPQHHVRTLQNVRLRCTRMLLLMALVMAMVCWTVMTDQSTSRVRAELEQLEAESVQVSGEVGRLEQLEQVRRTLQEQQALIERMNPLRPRSELICDLAHRLPPEIVLTRLEVEVQQRQAAQERTAGSARRRGQKSAARMETADRLAIEGFAANDLALARFLQEMTEPRPSGSQDTVVTAFKRGDLSFTRDALYRDKNVRVFRATFQAADGQPAGGLDGLAVGRN